LSFYHFKFIYFVVYTLIIKGMQSRVSSLEQSLALAQFTVNLMEDKRGKDDEFSQLKHKFVTELEIYKQLLGIFLPPSLFPPPHPLLLIPTIFSY
jgi:hypothetical protein